MTSPLWHLDAVSERGRPFHYFNTGVTPQTRQAFAGYTGNGGEDGVGAVVDGVTCVSLWINSVYHRLQMLGSSVDVGFSVATDSTGNGVCVMESGTPATLGGFAFWGGQIPAAPVVYPYKGKTGVPATFYATAESPNPVSGWKDTNGAPITVIGEPVSVALGTQSLLGANLAGFVASDVTITAFSLTAQGSATPVNTRIVTATGVLAGAGIILTPDVHGYLGYTTSFLMPLAPLTPNTIYNAVFAATVKGKPVNVSWSFVSAP